jgi:hypothetical protein
MADTPSSILLLRLQSIGSNVNLWGGYLNDALKTLERASKGYQAYAVTGDATLSWTNYSPINDGSVAFLKLTGPISSAAALTFPGYQHFLGGWNTTGSAITIKCSGGTGVTVQNGDRFLLYCDGVDYCNAAPTLFAGGLSVTGALAIAGKVTGMSPGTANTDGVTVQQMAQAIAASVPLGTAGTFLNSIADTTRGFAADKVTASGLLKATTVNAGGNESLNIATTGYTAIGTDTYAITPSPAITAYAAGQAFLVTFTNANTTAPTINVNGLGAKAITKSGATALDRGDISAGAQRLVTYDGTQFQISGVSAPSPGASEGLFMSQNFSNWGTMQ